MSDYQFMLIVFGFFIVAIFFFHTISTKLQSLKDELKKFSIRTMAL